MSFHNVKQSILALPMLGAAAIASLFSLGASQLPNLSQIQQNSQSINVQESLVAYRASGRIDTGWTVSYRASGRFGIEAGNSLAYRGSERGIEQVAYRASGRFGQGMNEVISYRASGRFNPFDGKPGGLAYRGSERGVEQIAYRASGRFEQGFGGLAYRGSERGITNQFTA